MKKKTQKILLGKHFGKLVVIRASKKIKRGDIVWECLCECGNTIMLPTYRLLYKSGTRSCGCLVGSKRKELTGKRFGKLVALEPTNIVKGKSIVWRCICDCGNEVLVKSGHLLSSGQKGTSSCGCLKGNKLNLIGKKFGKLTVIRETPQRRTTSTEWECSCSCGEYITVPATYLVRKSKKPKHCGCLNKKFGEDAAFNVLYQSYKKRAAKNGLIFTLTRKEFRTLTKQPCVYCASKPFQVQYIGGNNRKGHEYIYSGIDRIDSSKGYTLDNCSPCCKICNFAKSNMNVGEFLLHITKIIKNNKKIILTLQNKHIISTTNAIKLTKHIKKINNKENTMKHFKSTYVGLDLSLTNTGICVLGTNNRIIHLDVIATKKLRGGDRLIFIKEAIKNILNKYEDTILNIFVEGYSYGSRGRAVFNIGELGGVISVMLLENKHSYFIVPPKTLKLFICNSGNAPKSIMFEQVYRKYKIGSEHLLHGNDNALDAFCLAKFGESYTQWMLGNINYLNYELRSFKKIKDRITFQG